MADINLQTAMPVNPEVLYAWHARPGVLHRLVPPWQTVEVERHEGIEDGDRAVIRLVMGPLKLKWVALHRGHVAGRQFVDVQEEGPFAAWRHAHRFLPAPEGEGEGEGEGSVLEDDISFTAPLGPAGALVEPLIAADIRRAFRWRHARTLADLTRHAAFSDRPRLRVAITGASGLVGRSLTAFLRTGGHRVVALVRRDARGPEESHWRPSQGLITPEDLSGFDAVVHLAGENIGVGAWTEARKAEFRTSRVAATRLLAESLAGLEDPPRALINASAVGWYGDRGDEVVDESSGPGQGFLATLCSDWEAACAPAREAGLRVVNTRIGVALSAAGGALAEMALPAKLGLGGPLGGGRQVMSWIALDDVVGAIHHLLFSEIAGPVNLTAPHAVRQAELAKTLGRVLRRPAALPAPAAALRLIFGGEKADNILLGGARALPSRLEADGFQFLFEELEPYLRSELGRR